MENARITVTNCLSFYLSSHYVGQLFLHFKKEYLRYDTKGEEFEKKNMVQGLLPASQPS